MVGVDTANVIVKPLISEKAANLAGANQYVFVVRKDANRLQVRAAIKTMYGVSPISINVLNVRGKKVRFGRTQGTRSDWKKAVITLPAGQTINVYEGV
ncbi:50S ribosomal protein L23 [Candidatus Uhrbacteria bacterium]|nr:50S ribosomal protein L23 [Candidatus Uhrbacteria bacterium]